MKLFNRNQFKKFLSHYELDNVSSFHTKYNNLKINIESNSIIEKIGGNNILFGAMKFLTIESSQFWKNEIKNSFEKYSDTLIPISIDWCGRIYSYSIKNPNNEILMFDLEEKESYSLDLKKFNDFLNFELINNVEEILDLETFRILLHKYNLKKLPTEKVFSFKTPLSLGGNQEIEDYELMDIEVNWGILSQL